LNKVKLMIEQNRHSSKPVGAEIGVIRNSLLYTSDLVSNVNVNELATAISQGKTIQGMIPDFKKGGNTDDHFVEQQIFCLDFDNKTDEERITLQQIHERCNQHNVKPFLISESFSSSDSNPKYHVLFAEKTPTTNANTARTKILSLLATFPEADPACKDPSRIIFGTAANKKVEPYGDFTDLSVLSALPDPEPEPPAPTLNDDKTGFKLDYTNISNKTFRSDDYWKHYDVDVLLTLIDVNALEYQNWITVTAAYKTNGGNFDIWQAWNAGYTAGKLKQKADKATWNGLNGKGVGRRSLTDWAKRTNPDGFSAYKTQIDEILYNDKAYKEAKKQAKREYQAKKSEYSSNGNFADLYELLDGNNDGKALQIEDIKQYFIDHNISVKLNEITHDIDVFYNNKLVSKYIGNKNLFYNSLENEFNKINVTMMKKYKIKFKGVSVDKVCRYTTNIAHENKYNPVLELISSQSWSGTDRLTELYGIMKIDESDSLSRSFVRKWLMQCYCGLHNNMIHPFSLDIVLVLHGKQGIGKTRLFERLALKADWFGEGRILDPSNKDTLLNCFNNWICELGEIGATLKKDMNILKAAISESTDTIRAPYDRSATKNPRRTSFCGTVNDEKFLVDTTGNRRFAIVPLYDKMDIKQILSFNALDLWRQIKSIVDSEISSDNTIAACFRLTDELEQQEERNSSFAKELKGEAEVKDILSSLNGLTNDGKGHKITITRMNASQFISNHSELSRYTAAQIKSVLIRLGYECTNENKTFTFEGKRCILHNTFMLPYVDYNSKSYV